MSPMYIVVEFISKIDKSCLFSFQLVLDFASCGDATLSTDLYEHIVQDFVKSGSVTISVTLKEHLV